MSTITKIPHHILDWIMSHKWTTASIIASITLIVFILHIYVLPLFFIEKNPGTQVASIDHAQIESFIDPGVALVLSDSGSTVRVSAGKALLEVAKDLSSLSYSGETLSLYE